MWHCPHCGAPQAESARCWVCRRSSTTCSTCRHFRKSLAADVGYCGRDRARAPLTGVELRPCWEEGARERSAPSLELAPGAEPPLAAPDGAGRRSVVTVRGGGGPLDRPDPMRLRGFVPLDELAEVSSCGSGAEASARQPDRRTAGDLGNPPRPPVPSVSPAILGSAPDWAAQTSLFGDSEA